MKRFIYIFILGLCFCGCASDEEDNPFGKLVGSVSDRTTGEPVSTVNVSLSPGGHTTVTGSDGSFSYSDLEAGTYTVNISKEGYTPSSGQFAVKAGDVASAHLLIERIPAEITADRELLDFGEDKGVTTLSFTIVNRGYSDLAFKVEVGDCKWLTVDPQVDLLPYGKTATIVVKIDRSLLASGENKAVIVVRSTSGAGNVEITVKAIGEYRATASVNTLDATDITSNNATLWGEITNVGAPKYTERGFVYHTETEPTFENKLGTITAPITEEPKFSATVQNLTPTQSYYVRAFCKQKGEIIYGNVVSFKAEKHDAAIYTSAVTQVEATKATLNASISDAGNPEYTERGFCYGTVPEPTIANTRKPVAGQGVGDFSLQITGLAYPATYYVRAYMIQAGVPIYGNIVSFKTEQRDMIINTSAVTQVEATKATLNASISDAGNPEYTERGFCYGTVPEPTIANTRKPVAGQGVGDFSLQITGLKYPTTYYARAYAIQSGKPVYGNVVSFKTVYEQVELTTSSVTDVETNSAQFNAVINNVGMPGYTVRGFCYSATNTSPTVSANKTTEYSSAKGSFRKAVSNLKEGTTYYVRAYAVQDNQTFYGNVVSFNTVSMPIVNTSSVTGLTKKDIYGIGMYQWSATFKGTIVHAGEPEYTNRGFVYGTTYDPTVGTGDKVSVSGSGTGSYSVTVSGLKDLQTYYVRAYAKTKSGYVYGTSIKFNTF